MNDTPMLAVQRWFRDAALGRDPASLVGLVDGTRVPADARLRIYRHHVATSLAAALGATFASTKALVGEGFFDAMARAWVTVSPPTGPVLAEYGEGFADHVAAWEAAKSLPWLGDVARLDWQLTLAFNADPGPALDAASLAAAAPDELAGKPLSLRGGVSLLCSEFPVDRIWQLGMGNDDGEARVDPASGGVDLVVFLRDDDAAFVRVEPADAAWLDGCARGEALDEAVARAGAIDSSFDFGACLTRALAHGWLAPIK